MACKVNRINKPFYLMAFLIFAILIPQKAFSQYPNIKRIDASVFKEKIILSWTTPAGFSCQDIYIELGKDSLNFKRVGTIFGICGDTTEKDYSFIIDTPHLNTTNFLRLELGGIGFSKTVALRVISAKNNVVVVPHPANKFSELYFDNPYRKKTKIAFYTLEGKLLSESSTASNLLKFDDLSLPEGTVIYVLKKEDETPIRGVLIIASL